MCRGKDSRSNLDNLANAALMASRVERATTTAPAVATAGTASGRHSSKRARTGAVSNGAVANSPARTDASDSPARTISGSPRHHMSAASKGKLATGSEPAVTSRHVAQNDLSQPANNDWQADQQYAPAVGFSAQTSGLPAGTTNDMMHDPIAAAIKNATDAITTDGELQHLIVHGLNTQPHSSQDMQAPGSAPADHLPQHLVSQQVQLSYHMPDGEVAAEGHPDAVAYPLQPDGTVTITTSQTPEGAAMMRQPEGLLIVRDPESGKEHCLGKLLGNSKQTSMILQAANFLEPCS